MPGSMTWKSIEHNHGGHRARRGVHTLARDNHRHHSYLNPCQRRAWRRIQAAAGDSAAGRHGWQGFLEKTNRQPPNEIWLTDCGFTHLADAEPIGSARY